MRDDVVKQSDMKRNEWIIYKWVKIQVDTDGQIIYLKTGYRPIEEAKEAAEQFDEYHKNFVVK